MIVTVTGLRRMMMRIVGLLKLEMVDGNGVWVMVSEGEG
jgi:hypothetical protein